MQTGLPGVVLPLIVLVLARLRSCSSSITSSSNNSSTAPIEAIKVLSQACCSCVSWRVIASWRVDNVSAAVPSKPYQVCFKRDRGRNSAVRFRGKDSCTLRARNIFRPRARWKGN